LTTYTGGKASTDGVGADNAVINPISSNYYSALRTRSVIEPDFIFTDFPKINSVPKDLSIDYSKILNKPFFIGNIDWNTTQGSGVLLNHLEIPFSILTNELSKYPFNTSVLYRAKVSLIYQVAATPMHQGTVIVAAVPVGTHLALIEQPTLLFNKMMTAPHAFLYANESTSIRVQVPFYSNSKLVNTDERGDTFQPNYQFGNYAEVVTVVLNPLAQPVSGSTDLTISVHAIFDELEFYVPHIDITFEAEGLMEIGSRFVNGIFSTVRQGGEGLLDYGKEVVGDFLDSARGFIKRYTGLHSPNYPQTNPKTIVTHRQNGNSVDTPTSYEKLDPYYDYARITQDSIFDTTLDEMDMKHILSKPYYVATFKVSKDDRVGKCVFSRPISPYMQKGVEVKTISPRFKIEQVPVFDNPLQLFYMMSKYWRGGLNIHIQSNMSNFHFCKLQVARNYSPVEDQTTGLPKFSDLQNLMVETLEFSGGGQVQTISMPYISALEVLPVTTDANFVAKQHGMYYIYLSQPLVSNGAVPVDVYFNVYVSAADDFQLYGYSTFDIGTLATKSETSFVAEAATMQPISDQSALTNPGVFSSDIKDEIMRPIVNVRDYMRRMVRVYRKSYSETEIDTANGVFQISLREIIRNVGLTSVEARDYDCNYNAPFQMVRRMFLGLQGGVKLKVMLNGVSSGAVWYVPPGFGETSDNLGGQSTWKSTQPFLETNPVSLQLRKSFDYQSTSNSFTKSWSAVTPTAERPNYYNASSNYSINTDLTYLMSNCTFEVHIPNISPYRFMGAATTNYRLSDDDITSPHENLGHIIVSTGNPQYVANDTDVEIVIFAGLDDEARLGYQVCAPIFFIPPENGVQFTPYTYAFDGTIPNFSYNNYEWKDTT